MSRKQIFGDTGNNYVTVNVSAVAYNITWPAKILLYI